jgi:hypothetical protein
LQKYIKHFKSRKIKVKALGTEGIKKREANTTATAATTTTTNAKAH